MNKDTPEEILKNIVCEFGEEIFLDKNRSIGLISDYFANEIKTKKMFTNAIRENLPKKLLDIKNLDKTEMDSNISKIKFYYKDDNGLDENIVNFIVDSFVYAFQIQPNTQSEKNNPIQAEQLIAEDLPTKVFTKDDIVLYEKDNKVEIPYGYTAIDDCNYDSFKNPISITIPHSVTEIGMCAFYYCEYLTSITIPGSVKNIDSFAFSHCIRLTSIVIPEGVISIGMSAFGYCRNLLEITLPDSLKNIEKGILDSCTRLKKIRCIKGSYAEQYVIENSLGKLIEYIKDDGYYNNKIANMSSAVLTKGDIEKYIKDNNISGPFSFIAPEGCKIIDDEAFYECKLLKSIVIPNSVEYIGERAFYNCTALVNINIPENLSSIGSHAFFTCESLTGITLPNSITEIEKGIFLWCRSLTELALPSSVKKIGDEAFHSCASLRITIPNSVEIIGEKALNLYGDKDGILYGFKRINELGRQISGKQYAEAKVICKKGSYVEKYMLENSLRELIEYM